MTLFADCVGLLYCVDKMKTPRKVASAGILCRSLFWLQTLRRRWVRFLIYMRRPMLLHQLLTRTWGMHMTTRVCPPYEPPTDNARWLVLFWWGLIAIT